MAAIRRAGRLEPFLAQLAADDELDDETKEQARRARPRRRSFLLAVEDYLQRTDRLH